MNYLNLNNLSILQTKELDVVSCQIKKEFNQLTEKILTSNKTNLTWLLHPLVSRNPYHSDLFIQLCYLTLAKKFIDDGKCKNKLIVQNHFQKSILNKYLKSKNTECTVAKTKHNIKLNKLIYGIYSVFERSFLYLRSRDKHRVSGLAEQDGIIILDTFLLGNSLKAGRYIDRYYPNILDSLSSSKVKHVFWVPTILGKFKSHQVHSVWNDSEENILYKQDLLRFSDYTSAIMMLFGTSFNGKTQYKFKDLNISKLIRHEFRIGKVSKSAFEGLLNFFFFKRLKENNVKLELVINWNENQAIDKGFIKGAKTYYPEVYSKGYQGYIISTDYNFYIQPTEYEINNGVIPDEICVIGKSLESRIKENKPNLKVTTCPAYRFQNLYKDYPVKKDRQDNILVVLPIGINESYNIISTLSYALKNEHIDGYSIFIKSHPLINIKKLKRICGPLWLKLFKIIDGDFNEIVANTNIVIGSASSTLMESIARGIPVIIIGNRNGLTQNPIPETVDQALWLLCYTPEDIINSIKTFMERPDNVIQSLKSYSRTMRINYFMPVGYNNINLLEKVISN